MPSEHDDVFRVALIAKLNVIFAIAGLIGLTVAGGCYLILGDVPPWAAFLILFAVLILLFFAVKATVSQELEWFVRGKRNEAIAMTTQMMAHDVRKPFSMLRMGLGLLSRTQDPDEQRRLVSRLVPEVERSMLAVNDMLRDVMEIGSGDHLNLEAQSLEALCDGAIAGIKRLHPDARITFDRTFEAETTCLVDAQKMQRVLHNILENAVQALSGSDGGGVWLSARKVTGGWIELTIGNDGPLIEAQDLTHVFDAFFTKNKRRGTGLGLAIAHKVVSEHGGAIRCESTPEGGTQFVLTVPAAEGGANASAAAASSEPETLEDPSPSSLPHEVPPMHALVIDDERIYGAAIVQLAASTPSVTIDVATDSAQALAACEASSPALVVCDLDLGPRSADGFEVIRSLRGAGSDAFVCVHSNRDSKTDRALAEAAGADLYLPKPMEREHWERLTAMAAERQRKLRSGASTTHRPTVIFVDDCVFTREAWEAALPETDLRAFPSPEAMWDAVERDPELLACALGLVTDYHFEDASDLTGIDLAKAARERTRLPVLLCSNADPTPEERRLFDGVLPKDPPAWAELRKRLTREA